MENQKFERYDFVKEVGRMKFYLRPVAKLITTPNLIKYKTKIKYINGTDKIKGPFLLLCNHNAFLDFSVAYKALGKNRGNFVVAIDGFIKREQLLRNVGCICKRKFTNDPWLIKQLENVVNRGDVAVIYPEARYSLCGTTAVLPQSLGKLAKHLDVPVAILMCHGHHVNSPFWDTSHTRGIKYDEAEYKLLFTKEEVEKLSFDEINEKIVEEFQYDDFKWQKDNNIIVNDKNRAVGLHKVLYQCPHCGKEFHMTSFGSTLKCESCGKEWEMTELGELKAKEGETEFSHIPDWYEWERSNVRKEIQAGTYSTKVMPVAVKSLPNAKDFVDVGFGTMVHNMNGFHVSLEDKSLSDTNQISLKPLDTYSVHIEYQYLFKNGDCVDLNTSLDTWYIYPYGCEFSVTKIALATEELYQYYKAISGREIKKGLA